MKKLTSILLLLTLFACDSSLQITSTKKQTIIPGIQTVKPYTKYLIEVNVTSDHVIKVDSVVVFEKDKNCVVATHFVRDLKTKNVVTEINVLGKYVIDATVKESSEKATKDCKGDVDKVVVYYSKNNHAKSVEITSFTQETVRRR